MTAPTQPYSGQTGKCVKCGGTNASATFARTLPSTGGSGTTDGSTSTQEAIEALIRVCGICGYSWQEKPADAK